MSKNLMPDFLMHEDIDNIYRTKRYIVTQVMGMQHDDVEDNIVISFDTFFLRTPVRDAQYNVIFKDKVHPNGKRMPSATYTRKYIV